jgi:hypothetical protein
MASSLIGRRETTLAGVLQCEQDCIHSCRVSFAHE